MRSYLKNKQANKKGHIKDVREKEMDTQKEFLYYKNELKPGGSGGGAHL